MAKTIYNKFLVIKQDWIKENLNSEEINLLSALINKATTGKPIHSYYVVNVDEPYAEKVKELILNEEDKK